MSENGVHFRGNKATRRVACHNVTGPNDPAGVSRTERCMDSTQDPSSRESSPQSMTPEQIESIKRSLDLFRNGGFVPTSFLAEMAYNTIVEIERLRDWLRVIEDADGFYASELAGHALAGEVVRQ